ncbi:MAG: PorP/SprF family type IX secretion system membrane protein, partial [Bacteroidales bacterium]
RRYNFKKKNQFNVEMEWSKGTYVRMVVLFCLFACVGRLAGQSDLSFNNHWAMPNRYNPAAAGRDDVVNWVAAGRLQWAGMEKAPYAIVGLIDMPIRFLEREHGVGMSVISEKANGYHSTFVGLQYAFKLKIGEGMLQFGVQPSIVNTTFTPSKTDSVGGMPATPGVEMKGKGFDLNAGLYYSKKGWYAGLSVAHLTQPKIGFNEKDSVEIGRNLYFMGGGNIKLNNTLFELDPALLICTDMKNIQAEGSLRVTYSRLMWIGAGYRYDMGVIALCGVHLKNVDIGYSYDHTLSSMVDRSRGSHELFVRYRLKIVKTPKKYFKHRSARIL